MGFLTREAILDVSDIATGEVEVPEWGGSVRIRALSGVERDRLEASIMGGGNKPRIEYMRARVVAASVIDEHGKLMFSETDIKALGRKSAAALNRVFEATSKLSAVTPADVDELAGNSEAGPSEGSPSDSPATSGAPSGSS